MEIPPLDTLSLAAWEIGGRELSTDQQASLLLSCLFPGGLPGTFDAWALGRRNAALLCARVQVWGTEMAAVAVCPHCAAAMEIAVPVPELLAAAKNELPETVTVREAAWQVTLRLPTAEDLAYMAGRSDAAEEERAVHLLLERCAQTVVSGEHREPTDALTGTWPPGLLVAAAAALAAADPLAETRLQVECDACRQVWETDFDFAGFFLTELRAHGERVLDEVHQIASSYGWTEREILSLSRPRRAAYRARIENG